MNKISFFILLIPFFVFSQNLNCSDFKIGNFIMTSDTYPNIKFKIFRDNEIQTEQIIELDSINNKFPKEKIVEKIEWIDDCNYILFFKSLDSKDDGRGKFINENGGISTEIIPLNNRCYRYISKMRVDGKILELKGEICKEEYN